MAPQVFYRKWRPQTLAEVMGQEHITQTLANALATGRVAHAYLFCGPRGTGKTSTGRILAKAVNCLSNGKGEPCNACQICQAITEGRAFDLIEIDAASNRGIDEIRNLREKVNYAPDIARYKVYIIDEVHMLTEPAFNALLKTLEEPPSHVIFVLATTEVHKIPPTILSRCQRFDFRRIPQAAIVSRLEQICNQEGIHIETQALGLIAKAATGSLRDAENLLEQLTIYHGSDIDLHQVQALLGITGDWRAQELAKHILNKDVAAGLATINSVSNDGLDLRQFNRELVEYLRGVLLVKAGAEAALDLTTETLAEMKLLADATSTEEILKAIKLLGQVDLRFETQSTLPLEIALAECALPSPRQAKAPAPIVEAEAPLAEQPTQQPIAARPISPKTEPQAPAPQAPPEEAAELPLSERSIEYFRRRWNDVVQALRGVGSKGNLDALLRSACEPIALEGDTIVLGFYYPFHKERIEDPKYRHLVEKVVSEVFGAPYKLRCVLTPRDKKTKPQTLVEAALEMGGQIVNEEPGKKNE